MREETLINAVNDIDTIARLTEDLYDKYYNNEPDYWEKLKHQYAGMAMQGLLNNNDLLITLCNANEEVPIRKIVLNNAVIFATALVNRLKEEEKMQRIIEYLKERNIPKDSLEANSILEGYELGAERTKREMIEKAVEWMRNNLHEFSANVSYKSLFDEFKKAMQDESK
jgi:hypothetical protein